MAFYSAFQEEGGSLEVNLNCVLFPLDHSQSSSLRRKASRNSEVGENSELTVFVAYSQHIFSAFRPDLEVESGGRHHVMILLVASTELPRGFALHWKTAF